MNDREFNGKSNGAITPVIRFSMEKSFINEKIQPTQTPMEDEAYCPPTPVPKKSILKDPNFADKNIKQVKLNLFKTGPSKIVTHTVFGESALISD